MVVSIHTRAEVSSRSRNVAAPFERGNLRLSATTEVLSAPIDLRSQRFPGQSIKNSPRMVCVCVLLLCTVVVKTGRSTTAQDNTTWSLRYTRGRTSLHDLAKLRHRSSVGTSCYFMAILRWKRRWNRSSVRGAPLDKARNIEAFHR